MKKILLCPACEAGEHTSPPNGSVICMCTRPTCNCSVIPPRTV